MNCFKLRLLFNIQNKSDGARQTFNLNFRPTCTVLKVKQDASNLTDIPVSRQNWTGWPVGISDDLTLAQIDIPRHHEMQLSLLPRSSSRNVRKICKPKSGGNNQIYLHTP